MTDRGAHAAWIALAGLLTAGPVGVLAAYGSTGTSVSWWLWLACGLGFFVGTFIFAALITEGARKRRRDRKAQHRRVQRRVDREERRKQRLPEGRDQPSHRYLLASGGRPVLLTYPKRTLGMRVIVHRVGSNERYKQKDDAGRELPDEDGIGIVFPDGFIGAESAVPGEYEAVWELDVNIMRSLAGEPREYGEVARDRFWYLRDDKT